MGLSRGMHGPLIRLRHLLPQTAGEKGWLYHSRRMWILSRTTVRTTIDGLMEFELRIYEVDPDYRWNWMQAIEHPLRFISLRDDRTFVCVNGAHTSTPSEIN